MPTIKLIPVPGDPDKLELLPLEYDVETVNHTEPEVFNWNDLYSNH